MSSLLVLMTAAVLFISQSSFVKSQDSDLENWKQEVLYDISISLMCSGDGGWFNWTNYDEQTTNQIRLSWILPSGRIVQGNGNYDDFQISGTHPEGQNLTIFQITDTDFGIYHCLVMFPNYTIYTVRHGINIDGAYFGDLLERYREQAIVGAIAAGTVLVVLSFLCLISYFRYRENDDIETDNFYMQNPAITAYDNEVMDIEDLGQPSYAEIHKSGSQKAAFEAKAHDRNEIVTEF